MLLEISRINSWAEVVHCKLICMLTNMFYQVPDGSSSPMFLVDQIDVLGGVDFVCLEVCKIPIIKHHIYIYTENIK